jgi:tripartite-type tricarboxylate transporter receptor subunit TctC
MKQPFVVDNKAGAAGPSGAAAVKRAAPDLIKGATLP